MKNYLTADWLSFYKIKLQVNIVMKMSTVKIQLNWTHTTSHNHVCMQIHYVYELTLLLAIVKPATILRFMLSYMNWNPQKYSNRFISSHSD